jgi:hypothetical protein
LSQLELSRKALAVKRAAKPAQTVEPLLYSIEETCVRLGGIGKTKLYAEIAAGELETTRIGDRQFTTDEQQRAYIARKQQAAA